MSDAAGGGLPARHLYDNHWRTQATHLNLQQEDSQDGLTASAIKSRCINFRYGGDHWNEGNFDVQASVAITLRQSIPRLHTSTFHDFLHAQSGQSYGVVLGPETPVEVHDHGLEFSVVKVLPGHRELATKVPTGTHVLLQHTRFLPEGP